MTYDHNHNHQKICRLTDFKLLLCMFEHLFIKITKIKLGKNILGNILMSHFALLVLELDSELQHH